MKSCHAFARPYAGINRLRVAALTAALLLPPASFSQAAIFVPVGVNPGETYHLAFVSSTTTDAFQFNIAYYNTHVQTAADAAFIGVSEGVDWFAIGSDLPGVNARDNALVSAPVYLLNSTKIADGFTDMWDGTLDQPISIDETGGTFLGSVWTGSLSSGLVDSNRELGTVSGNTTFGDSSAADGQWMIAGNLLFFSEFPIYALSEELTAPGAAISAVPEPSSALLLILGALLLRGAARNRRASGTPA